MPTGRSESCDMTCERESGGHTECDAGWLEIINSCKVMKAAFPAVKCHSVAGFGSCAEPQLSS